MLLISEIVRTTRSFISLKHFYYYYSFLLTVDCSEIETLCVVYYLRSRVLRLQRLILSVTIPIEYKILSGDTIHILGVYY